MQRGKKCKSDIFHIPVDIFVLEPYILLRLKVFETSNAKRYLYSFKIVQDKFISVTGEFNLGN